MLNNQCTNCITAQLNCTHYEAIKVRLNRMMSRTYRWTECLKTWGPAQGYAYLDRIYFDNTVQAHSQVHRKSGKPCQIVGEYIAEGLHMQLSRWIRISSAYLACTSHWHQQPIRYFKFLTRQTYTRGKFVDCANNRRKFIHTLVSPLRYDLRRTASHIWYCWTRIRTRTRDLTTIGESKAWLPPRKAVPPNTRSSPASVQWRVQWR